MRGTLLCSTLLALAIAGCNSSSSGSSAGRPAVVATEGFWGSIAAQLAGDRMSAASIVASPDTDPHSYEPNAADARRFAAAKVVIENGIGYDPWAPKLIAANPVPGRAVVDVGTVVGAHTGDNPHRWYSPADVKSVIAAITATYVRVDPKDRAYFEARRAALEGTGMARYHQLIQQTRARYAGVPVGASESIFAMLSPSLGLRLVTPPAYMRTISEGTDPTAQDKLTVDRQIRTRQIAVWIYNSQNTTPDVQRLTAAARSAGIPVVTVTETQTPESATFQAWQAAQLERLDAALAQRHR